ncbi:MAG: hypothetical protein CMJ23_13940 [Phycisphaerae bacterium]|nr:hypothetical protein [Phycisphaerae bacterium]
MRRGIQRSTILALSPALFFLPGCEPPAEAPAEPAPTGAAAATTDPWGPMPETVEPFYFTEFEQWVGQPIATQDLARLIQRPIPASLDEGRAFLMFYREDCEHCHHMLEEWFTQSVPAPTIAVAVPDADPENAIPFPSTLVDRRSLPVGPQYVISTPALFAIKDGVVTGFASDPDQPDQVEACLSSNSD